MLNKARITRIFFGIGILLWFGCISFPVEALSPKSIIKKDVQEKTTQGRSFIDLNTSLPMPEEKPEINNEKLNLWISREEDPELRKVKQKLKESLTSGKISFLQFKRGLGEVCRELKQHLQPGNPFVLFLDMQMGSSKRWVYEIARRQFGLPVPAFYTYFAHGRNGYNKMWKQINDQGINTFLIIDDAAYSGKQIHTQIIEIAQKSNGIMPPTVIVAVPYMSSKSLELIESAAQSHRVSLVIIPPYHVFPVVKDLFRVDEMKKMYEDLGFTADDFFKPIAYFDHKVPDELSLPKPLFEFFPQTNFVPVYKNKQSEYYRENGWIFISVIFMRVKSLRQ